jgi:hypothetical protein
VAGRGLKRCPGLACLATLAVAAAATPAWAQRPGFAFPPPDRAPPPPPPAAPAPVVLDAPADAAAALEAARQERDAGRQATNAAAEAVREAVAEIEQVSDLLERTALELGLAVEKTPDVTAEITAGGEATLDGLEVGRNWVCEAWADPGKIELDGNKLKVQFEMGAARKTAFTKIFRRKTRLTPADRIEMDVENLSVSPFRLALGLFVGFTYYETPACAVGPGRAKVAFDMGAKTFKSEDTHWQHQDALKGPVLVDKLTLLIYARKEGAATFDNLRITAPEPAPGAPLRP